MGTKRSVKRKKQEAKARHKLAKCRARYRKVLNNYQSPHSWLVHDKKRSTSFSDMLAELVSLNIKVLQTLLSDLNTDGYMYGWSGDYHKMIVHNIELAILERTVLK